MTAHMPRRLTVGRTAYLQSKAKKSARTYSPLGRTQFPPIIIGDLELELSREEGLVRGLPKVARGQMWRVICLVAEETKEMPF